jgi:hypothetical protein
VAAAIEAGQGSSTTHIGGPAVLGIQVARTPRQSRP